MTGSAGPLVNGAGRLGVLLDHGQVEKLERLVSELLRWNKAYNLTSITDPDLILTHHLLDSLSVHPELVGNSIAGYLTPVFRSGIKEFLTLLSFDNTSQVAGPSVNWISTSVPSLSNRMARIGIAPSKLLGLACMALKDPPRRTQPF